MPLGDALFAVIPIGEENGVTSKLLRKHLGMGSAASIRHKLNELAAVGLVEPMRVLRNARRTSLYFRLSKPSAGL
jgi:hypothetical protein